MIFFFAKKVLAIFNYAVLLYNWLSKYPIFQGPFHFLGCYYWLKKVHNGSKNQKKSGVMCKVPPFWDQMVKAITPSILVQFSRFLCLIIWAFQDLSFLFTIQKRGTCPHGQKGVLKMGHVRGKWHKLEKVTFYLS